MYSTRDVVLSVLSYRCNCPMNALEATVRLDALALSALDLVLTIAEVEDFEGIEVPLEGLEDLETVGELTTFCQRAVRRARARDELRKVS